MATIGPFCNLFINDFLVINSLLLKIKHKKLYVSILVTSIPFVFASIFKFIVRGPNPAMSHLCHVFLYTNTRRYAYNSDINVYI